MSKIPAPNYTQSPNILFDDTFKKLKEGELRVVLVLIRQTFGWHKSFDRISLNQLAEKSGMQRRSVSRSLESLIEKNLVEKKKFGDPGKERCYFALVVETPIPDDILEDDEISEEEMELLSNNSYQCPLDTTPRCHTVTTPSVHVTPTKETNQKKSSKEESIAISLSSCEEPKKERKEALHKEIDFHGGRFQNISTEQMDAWKRAYPGENIEAYIAQFEAVLNINPRRISSKTPWGARLNSWIRTQSMEKELLKGNQTIVEEKKEEEIKAPVETFYFYHSTALRFIEDWSEKLGMKGIISYYSNVFSLKIHSSNQSWSIPIYEKGIEKFFKFAEEKIKKEIELPQT